MDNFDVYSDIKARTNGEIYIGVVGPVRTGKSTFIKRFMELMVLPEIQSEAFSQRARDEPAAIRRRANHHDDRAEVYPRTGRHRKNG